jgi:hypothetical protein
MKQAMSRMEITATGYMKDGKAKIPMIEHETQNMVQITPNQPTWERKRLSGKSPIAFQAWPSDRCTAPKPKQTSMMLFWTPSQRAAPWLSSAGSASGAMPK